MALNKKSWTSDVLQRPRQSLNSHGLNLSFPPTLVHS